MGQDGAACFHMLSNDSREIPKAQWDEERFGMVCSKAESFKDLKAAILKLCKKTRMCSFETKQLVKNFADRLEYTLNFIEEKAAYGTALQPIR